MVILRNVAMLREQDSFEHQDFKMTLLCATKPFKTAQIYGLNRGVSSNAIGAKNENFRLEKALKNT
jgi:hypothetical protein